ncbi:MAG: Maf family protein [Lachnospiraceae bacterium]|nr:Maf family protein [Lachnospiraceae bacterium]
MLILASASPRRKELLSKMGLTFEIITADLDEKTDETDPGLMVRALSKLKAEAVFKTVKESRRELLDAEEPLLIIAADTLVFQKGRVLGKPKDESEAYDMLSRLQGKTHEVCTGVTVILYEKGKVLSESFHEETLVTFCPMSDAEIESYIASGEPMDKAGAYGIQGLSAKYIEKIDGDYFNVVGLPVSRLYREMKKIGFIKE